MLNAARFVILSGERTETSTDVKNMLATSVAGLMEIRNLMSCLVSYPKVLVIQLGLVLTKGSYWWRP